MSTKNWLVNNSDNWTTAADWTGGSVPAAADDVTITQGNPDVTTNVGTVRSVAITATGQSTFESGGMLSTTLGVNNAGQLYLDRFFGQGGSSLTIGGTLTNSSGLQIGNGGLSAATTVTASGLANTGTIELDGTTSTQATLNVTSAAGSGTAGHLTGTFRLLGDTLLQFASGQITSNDASVVLSGSNARIAVAATPASNSALAGLTANTNYLELDSSNVVTTTAGLNNTGQLYLDRNFGQGGSSLDVGGTLTNSNYLQIGNGGLSAADTVTATGLANTGTVELDGTSSVQATLNLTSAAGTGTAGHLTGTFRLFGDTLIQFASGQITSNDASIVLSGSNARIALAATPASNSALKGLVSNTNYLELDGNTVTTNGGLINSGQIWLDRSFGSGGASLNIAGKLTNANYLQIGNGGLSSADAVTATSLANTGTIELDGSATTQATLNVTSAAGTGTAGHLTGTFRLFGDTLVQFASGQITTNDASVVLSGSNARIALAATPTSNSALTGLVANTNYLELDNNTVSTSAALNNTGQIWLDRSFGSGGASLNITGKLTNSNYLQIGNGGLSSADTVTATSLANTGTIELEGSASTQATLNVTSAAGTGTAGHLTGTFRLFGDTLVQFASGQITTNDASVVLSGSNARIALAATPASNSALTGLVSNTNYLELDNGTAVTTNAALNNTGQIFLDRGFGSGGASLTIGGKLTNANYLQIGNGGLSSADTVTATSLANTGSIELDGGATTQATLNVTSAAGTGTAGHLTGTFRLSGDALVKFASGQITTNDASVVLSGSNARIALAATPASNSALTGLVANTNYLELDNNAVTTNAALNSSGQIFLDRGFGSGGASLTIGGRLTNSNYLQIGNGGLSSADTVTATSLFNAGTIELDGSATTQATLNVTSAAGSGTTGRLTGTFRLSGDTLVQFASGKITSNDGSLILNGANARVAIAATPASNSALTGLAANVGYLELDNGNAVTTAAALTNSGTINVDSGFGSGGASLGVGGALTNSGTINIGNDGDSAATTVSAASLVNAGTIRVGGTATNAGSLSITGAAVNSGTIAADFSLGRIQVGTYQQTASGILSLELAGTAAGQFTKLAATGGVTLQGGTLNITDRLGVTAGETFNVATFAPGSLTGTFKTLRFGATSGDGTSDILAGGSLTAGLVYNNAAGNIQLQVIATPATTAATWAGGTGTFSTAAKWDHGVPTFYSDVTIGAGANVTLNQDATIDSLTLTGGQFHSAANEALTIGSDVTVQTGATLSTNLAGDDLNIAGNVTNGGTMNVGDGIIEGNLALSGTLEIKSGTFTILGTISGTGHIIVDAGATLKLNSAEIGGTVVDNGTIEVAGGVTFDQNVTGSGTIAVDSQADLELAGSGPATLSFNGVGGGIKLNDPAGAQTSSIANLQAGDTINFANAVASSVAVVGDPTLVVTTSGGASLSYNLTGTTVENGSSSTTTNGTGGSQITLTSAPNNGGYDTAQSVGTGNDFAPALGTSYFLQPNNGGGYLNLAGQMSHVGTDWTLAFPKIPDGQTVLPFSLIAYNRNLSNDAITVTFKLISNGGDTRQLGGSSTIFNILPGGSGISASGAQGLGPQLTVQNGNPTVYEVDSVSSSGVTLPTETLTIVVGAVGGGGGSSGGPGVGNGNNGGGGGTGVITIIDNGDGGDGGDGDGNGSGSNGDSGYGWGDPHLRTFDGVAYDLQQVGEFVLAKSTLAGDNFEAQIRTAQWFSGATVSVITQVGVALGSNHVTIDLNRADTLEVDGVAVNLTATNNTKTLTGGTIELIAPNTYEIHSIHGETIDIAKEGSYLSVTSISLGPDFPKGKTVGLLGTDTGVAANDFQLRDGTILTQPISLDDLYQQFGDSWRITDATSLLDYGAGQTTATFTDVDFPADAVALNELPPAVVAAATAAVDAAGITDPTLRIKAIYDLALTNDMNFVDGAKTLQQEGRGATATLDPVKLAAPASLGISAPVAKVGEAASGTTAVVFTIYSTANVATDTVVHYAVIAPGAGFLGASGFGGTLPSGQVSIAAGQSTATLTITLPNGALGSAPSDILRVQISDSVGVPVISPTADVLVTNSAPVHGIDAIAGFTEIFGGGTLTHTGNAYTLDLGTFTQHASVASLNLAVTNLAAATGNELAGMFDLSGSGFTITGTGPFAGLDAGTVHAGLNVVVDTNAGGSHSETITLHPTQSNASGFNGSLPDITLTIIDTVNSPPVVTLTTGTDIISFPPGIADLVRGTAATINPSDSLTGNGSAKLVLLGGGTINIGAIAHFSGFNILTMDDNSFAVTLSDADLASGETLNVRATSTGSHTLTFNASAETSGAFDIIGGDATDRLTTGGGNDMLDGGAGADVLTGGAGNDAYFVDNAGDKVMEAANKGTDTVNASVSYTLLAGSSVEALRTNDPTGTSAIDLTGNELVNTIIGNAGSNQIDGGGGADTMSGLGGSDVYFVDNVGDKVLEAAGGGSDAVVVTSAITYALLAGQEVEKLQTASTTSTTATNLTGNEFGNMLIANAANNRLDGGAGADVMYGYAGNDVFYVDNVGDKAIEAAGGGSDAVVVTTAIAYTLTAGQEVEKLQTSSTTGTTATNLTGNEFGNMIIGNAAGNVLDGGAGADVMYGYAGNDTFYVDNTGDKVIEAAGGGTDTVTVTKAISYVLSAGQEVETLQTANTNGTIATSLTGNELANTLMGNAANNKLDGGAGADTMYGYAGNDVFYVDNVGDKVMEAAGGGNDAVVVTKAITYALSAGQQVEKLQTADTTGSIVTNLTGNEFTNTVIGNAAANVLDGKGGNDVLYGYGGNDTFVFDTTLDASTNRDTIADFTVGQDMIDLSHAIFSTVSTANLSTAFTTGTEATTAAQHLIYNAGTGALLYDADGSGAGAAVQFAKLSTGLELTAGQFKVTA